MTTPTDTDLEDLLRTTFETYAAHPDPQRAQALAATGTNPWRWITGDPNRDLNVAADTTQRIDGHFSQQIRCAHALTGPGVCTTTPDPVCHTVTGADGAEQGQVCRGVSEPAKRHTTGVAYSLMSRIEQRPAIDAALYHRAFDALPKDKLVFGSAPAPYDHITVAQLLTYVDQMTPDFWRGLSVLLDQQGGTTSTSDSTTPRGYELVPPEGIPRFVTCTDDGTLHCRPIVDGERLPMGAPLYSLNSDATWRAVPQRSAKQQQRRFEALVQAVFGRQLTDREQLVFAGLVMSVSSTATTSTGSGTVTAGAQTAPAPVRRARAVPTHR